MGANYAFFEMDATDKAGAPPKTSAWAEPKPPTPRPPSPRLLEQPPKTWALWTCWQLGLAATDTAATGVRWLVRECRDWHPLLSATMCRKVEVYNCGGGGFGISIMDIDPDRGWGCNGLSVGEFCLFTLGFWARYAPDHAAFQAPKLAALAARRPSRSLSTPPALARFSARRLLTPWKA